MKIIKNSVRKIIESFNPGFEQRHWDRQAFKSLGRNPPELMWEPQRQGPVIRQDAAGIQIEHLWYIFGGYSTEDDIISYIDVFDFNKNRWVKRFKMPYDMPQTHCGIALEDGRWLYYVGGQLGPQCSPPVAKAYVLDTQTDTWTKLPDLPEARYSPVVELWNGRLYAIGGSQYDRYTPSLAHYSIAVKDGKAVEESWQKSSDIFRGGPHRGSMIFENKFYLFGGQEGDYTREEGDPKCTCINPDVPEKIYSDVYCLDNPQSEWVKKTDMPVANSHLEFSIKVIDGYAVCIGGLHYKDPETNIITLSDAVQVYDFKKDQWKVVGRLPYRIKCAVIAYHNGYLYSTTGQRDKSVDDSSPGWYDDRVWRAKFDLPALLTL